MSKRGIPCYPSHHSQHRARPPPHAREAESSCLAEMWAMPLLWAAFSNWTFASSKSGGHFCLSYQTRGGSNRETTPKGPSRLQKVECYTWSSGGTPGSSAISGQMPPSSLPAGMTLASGRSRQERCGTTRSPAQAYRQIDASGGWRRHRCRCARQRPLPERC